MKYLLFRASVLAVAVLLASASAEAAPAKPKSYDGIVTQINLSDGSFVLRLRDGSSVTVKNPIIPNLFLTVKGILDAGVISEVSEMKMKSAAAVDAIPSISFLDPGSGQVGTQIMMSGTSFNRKANSIAIGTVQNALVNVPSKDGKTLAFRLPSTLCNQKTKANCPKIVTSPGTYNITVSNINGVSNAMPFQILPLAPLALTTDILPQTPTGARYEAPVEAVGGAESYQWRVSEGTLPPGLKLTQASCKETPCRTSALVRGIPTVPGTYQFEISLNSGSETVSRRFTITVVLGLSNPF